MINILRQVMLNNKQARQFILLKQGLLGEYKFIGESGVCDYIKQAGCIQYDPIDVCGKNAELVLQSRVKGFSKEMLYNLLYEDRKLIDYFDKNMSIFNLNEWQYFSRERTYYGQNNRSKDQINEVSKKIISVIESKGYVSSRDLKFDELVDWSWNPTSLSRAALESLYFQGELIIHHKKGTIKQYALANKHIPAEILYASDPNQTLEEHLEWRVLRRIGAVGMLWNKPSDAFLGMRGLKSNQRDGIFNKLMDEEKIIEIIVENISTHF